MPKVKKHKGLERLKSRYGFIFVTPWILGMLIFFCYPIIQSLIYTFSDLEITESGAVTAFTGLSNYKNILFKDPAYLDNLLSAFTDLLISMPFILVVSMVMALLLDGKYAGRTFFRGLYFLPVILSSGVVLQLFLDAGSAGATQAEVSSTVSFGMIDFSKMLAGFKLPAAIETYLSSALSNIFLLVWQSGIQTVLLIAGLQSIPEMLYEVARVEGANKWEEFWKITLPMMMRTVFLVVIFTIIELASANDNLIIKSGYTQFNLMEYGLGSSMLWFYYLFVGVFVMLLFTFYNKVCVRKWG